MSNLTKMLPKNVTKVDLIPIMRKNFFRTHQIRTLIAGSLPHEVEEDDHIDDEEAND